MNHLVLSLALALMAGLADLAGGLLSVARRGFSRHAILYSTAVAAGFIVAAAVLDRVPEAMTPTNPNGAGWILVGFLAIYLVENLFSTHAHDAEESHEEHPGQDHDHGHALVSQFQPEECLISRPASNAALVGLVLHTLFDGIAIAAGFMASPHTGAVMFLAVMFHKFPEGFSVSALMLAAGRSRRYAVLAAGALGASTFAGAVLANVVTHFSEAAMQQSWAQGLLSVATGTFLYIGCSDMIPATNKGNDRRSVALVVLGVALFLLSSWALRAAGVEAH